MRDLRSDLHPYHIDLGRPAYNIGHEAVGESSNWAAR